MSDMYGGFFDRVTEEAPECPVSFETVDRTNGVIVYLPSRSPDPTELEQIKATNRVCDGLELTVVVCKWYDRAAAEEHFLTDGHRFDPSSRVTVSDHFITHLKLAVDIARLADPLPTPAEAFDVIVRSAYSGTGEFATRDESLIGTRASFLFKKAPCFVDCDRTEARRLLTENRRSWLIRPSSYASTEFHQTETGEYAPTYTHLVVTIRTGPTVTNQLIGHRFGERYDRIRGDDRLWSEPSAADCLHRILREAFSGDARFVIDNYYAPP